jgi:hypothetical protein
MEVIRWMCKEPRAHLRETRFLVHTHNSMAGLMMVLQMRGSGYNAEFRPFGSDPARLLAGADQVPQAEAEKSARPATPLRRWLGWLRSWRTGRGPRAGTETESKPLEERDPS